jgi:uncharacterized membrane protein
MINVTLYHLKGQHASEQAISDLSALESSIPFQLILIPIDQNPYLMEKMSGSAPVIEVGPYLRSAPFSQVDLRIMIQAAIDRTQQLEKIHPSQKTTTGSLNSPNTSGDKLTIWLSRHFMFLFNTVAFLYVGIPFLAPVFMKINWDAPARVIYAIYSPMCHQLSFRSWFIFGEQLFYPREVAQVSGITTYEQAINPNSFDLDFAKKFIGNSLIGYKVALCQRDVAMYGSFVIFGLVFVISGRRFKPLPWYLWIILSLVPIGIDGLSQLPGLAQGLPDWLPIRESTPYLRLLTGFFFGFFTGWYLFPLVDQTMQETQILMQRKAVVMSKTQAEK